MDGEFAVGVDDGIGRPVLGFDEGFDGIGHVEGTGPAEAAVQAVSGDAIGSVFDGCAAGVFLEAVVGDELGMGERGKQADGGEGEP